MHGSTVRVRRARQRSQLIALLQHAAAHVPYYGDVLRAAGAVGPDGAVDLGRFESITLLDKDTVRRRFADLASDDLAQRTWNYEHTGGSTGDTVRLIRDRGMSEWIRALNLFEDDMVGRRADEKTLFLWASVQDLEGIREKFRPRVGQWLRAQRRLNSFRMSQEQMRDYVATINSYRPDHMIAYVESAYELARFAERNCFSVHSPHTIVTSAGTLQPHMRDTIERVFSTSVFNRYGSREVSNIAYECESHEGLHAVLPTAYIEILRPDGDRVELGEVGEVVVTSLITSRMPLIRYRIGDTAVWAAKPCTCGRPWPLLASVTGRMSDTFVTAEGGCVPGEYFEYVFYFQDWVQKFQVIQESVHEIRMRIVSRSDLPKAAEVTVAGKAEIERKTHLVMGDACHVTFEIVDDIAPTPSGKYRYTVSKVPVEGSRCYRA